MSPFHRSDHLIQMKQTMLTIEDSDDDRPITLLWFIKKDYLHLQDLTSNEETNSNWSKVDDPGGHLKVIIVMMMVIIIPIVILISGPSS